MKSRPLESDTSATIDKLPLLRQTLQERQKKCQGKRAFLTGVGAVTVGALPEDLPYVALGHIVKFCCKRKGK